MRIYSSSGAFCSVPFAKEPWFNAHWGVDNNISQQADPGDAWIRWVFDSNCITKQELTTPNMSTAQWAAFHLVKQMPFNLKVLSELHFFVWTISIEKLGSRLSGIQTVKPKLWNF